jgi:hypothetical protein
VGSPSVDRPKAAFEETTPCLTCRVRVEEASERLDEVLIGEQRSNVRDDVVAHLGRRGGDVARNLGAPIDYGDDVLEIVARKDVIAAAAMEGYL